jgi:hypothetical protein
MFFNKTSEEVTYVPTLLIILFGLMDSMTTFFGVSVLGMTEGNPLVAYVISTNVFYFFLIKFMTISIIAIIPLMMQKVIMTLKMNLDKKLTTVLAICNIGIFAILTLMVMAVVNNSILLNNELPIIGVI